MGCWDLTGAGKTTLIPPTSSLARIAGLDVTRQSAIVRGLLGLPRAVREERIAELLTVLRLDDAANRLARQYSGGMVRLLEIGQALLN